MPPPCTNKPRRCEGHRSRPPVEFSRLGRAETGKPREIAESALAHVVGGVEGAYFRSDLFERRRDLMDGWAAYLRGESGKVVRLRG